MTDYSKYRKNVNFIKKYSKAINAATGSEVDANANVESKNIATCQGEMNKKEIIGTNRLLMHDKIEELYGVELADEYIRQLESHEIYKHDETSIAPYCVSITMYPFLFNGLKTLGCGTSAPKHLQSFCGSFINLVYAVSSQFAGAVATPEFLTYFDYFVRKEYGDDYYKRLDEVVINSKIPQTMDDMIVGYFNQIVYSINTPASARNFQAVFWNIAYFDKPYFDGIFEDFVFPDGTAPQWESVNWLQKRFMKWFNKERLKSVLTFPVETMNILNDGEDAVDKEYADFNAEMYAEGHSFFTYTSDSVDSLASCCRLRNAITENTFSYTLGAGGIATGSKGVITMNINRLVQNAVRNGKDISEAVTEQVDKIHKYLTAYNEIIKGYFQDNMLPVYSAGFISLEKQFLTAGVNGVVESAEFLGIDISPNEEYFSYLEKILKPIYESNKAARTKELMFNTEFVPKMCGDKAA